jgi:hypothetical protein
VIGHLADAVSGAGLAVLVTMALAHFDVLPWRLVRRWEDQLLRDELASAKGFREEDPHPVNAAYYHGLHTAAVLVGTVQPRFRQERALRRRTAA